MVQKFVLEQREQFDLILFLNKSQKTTPIVEITCPVYWIFQGKLHAPKSNVGATSKIHNELLAPLAISKISINGGNNNVKPIIIPRTGESPILWNIDQQIVTGIYQKTAWAGIHKKSSNPLANPEILTNEVPSPFQFASKMLRNPKINPLLLRLGLWE